MSTKQIFKIARKFIIKLAQEEISNPVPVQEHNGTLTVVSPQLKEIQAEGEEKLQAREPNADLFIANRLTRDEGKTHMTLINAKEMSALVKEKYGAMTEDQKAGKPRKEHEKIIKEQILDLVKNQFSDDWTVEGLGKAENEKAKTYFMVISWNTGNQIRRDLGLSPKDFHVTVGFDPSDIHDAGKGLGSLVKEE